MPERDDGARAPVVASRPIPRQDLVAALSLLPLALFLFRDAVFGRGVLFRRDISLVWYPQVESFVRCVSSGSWPLWDPYRGFGQPLLADPSAQVLYPTTWLNLILPPWITYTIFVVVHLWFSGVGLYALARRWDVARAGALVGGLVWMASGPFLSLASLWHHMAGAAWIPWVFLAADVAFERRDIRAVVLWGVAMAAQILAGSADMVFMTLVALGIVGIARVATGAGSRAGNGVRMALTAAPAGLIALGLSACQWVPTLAMAAGTARLGLDASDRTVWSLHPLSLLELALPFHWNLVPLSPSAVTTLLESRDPWLHSIYFGGPALGLAAAGLALGDRGRRLALALIAAGALGVALGRHAWVYDLVMTVLPPARILRFPMKAMVPCAFAVSVLAAMGLDAARIGSGRARLVLLWALAFLSTVAAGAIVSATWATGWWAPSLLARRPGLPSDLELLSSTTSALWVGLAATTTAAGAALWLCKGRLSRPLAAAALVGGLAVADLAVAQKDLHPVAPKAIFTHRPEVVGALTTSTDPRVYVYDYSTLPRFRRGESGGPSPFSLPSIPPGWTPLQALTLGALDYLTPPTPGRWGIRGSYDLDLLGLQPRPLADLNDFLRTREGQPTHTRLLRMGNVSKLVDLAPPARWPDLRLAASFPSLFAEPIRVYQVPEPLPRTYAVGSAYVTDGSAALERLDSRDFDPAKEVLLPTGPAARGRDAFSGRSQVILAKSDRVVVRAELSDPGFVVLVDAYDAGWRVAVDGNDAPLLRANVAFRGTPVPEGAHVVSFVYRPRSVLAGAMASAVTLLLATTAALRGKARAVPS
ncbi:MAG: hypothetical protein ACHQNV_04450 [Vicinamibacteria bacterium]